MSAFDEDFLEPNYDVPRGGGGAFMKLMDGENRIRILSRPIVGWLDWKDKKPYRFRMDERPAKSFDPDRSVKHFWAMFVWNYGAKQIQLLEIQQKTIQESIRDLTRDQDYGNPRGYDLKIKRSGQGMETEYSVVPTPPRDADPEIVAAWAATNYNLDALFIGGDPFSPAERQPGDDDFDDEAISSAPGVNGSSSKHARA